MDFLHMRTVGKVASAVLINVSMVVAKNLYRMNQCVIGT